MSERVGFPVRKQGGVIRGGRDGGVPRGGEVCLRGRGLGYYFCCSGAKIPNKS